MESSIILLARQHILMRKHLEWQTTKEKRSQPAVLIVTDLMIAQTAMLKLSWWIWILWLGAMDLTFPFPRKFDSILRIPEPTSGSIQFSFRSIFQYSTASTLEAAYIIGGFYADEEVTGEISVFQKDSWHQFGTLSKARVNHGSISIDNEFVVIGGSVERFDNSFDSILWK